MARYDALGWEWLGMPTVLRDPTSHSRYSFIHTWRGCVPQYVLPIFFAVLITTLVAAAVHVYLNPVKRFTRTRTQPPPPLCLRWPCAPSILLDKVPLVITHVQQFL
jgi:hypothetical protein